MERTTPDFNDSLPALREDRQMLILMHLSQLLNLFTAVGGIVVPILLWQLKKDKIQDMDEQGKEVVNFQISLFIYYVISAFLLLILIGFVALAILAVINLIFPIIYGIKAQNGETNIKYPLNLRFIK